MRLIEAQKRLVEIWEYVTPASIDSRAADLVVEGRQHGKKYSSCGDLAHYGYHTLGLRHPQINRAPWKSGVNVSRLAYWEGVSTTHIDWAHVDGGDVLIRVDAPGTEHVVCVLANHQDGTISTAEYGQRKPQIGQLFTRSTQPGSRPWKWWLPLDLVLEACEGPR